MVEAVYNIVVKVQEKNISGNLFAQPPKITELIINPFSAMLLPGIL